MHHTRNTPTLETNGLSRQKEWLSARFAFRGAPKRFAVQLICILALLGFGMVVGMYGAKFGEHALLLLGAPLLIPLGVLLFISPRWFFLLLIAGRCALDPVLESARFSSSFGLGAILNLMVIGCAFWMCVQRNKVPIKQTVWLWIPPLLVMILGVSYSPDIMPALRRLIAFLSYFSVFIIGFILASEGYFKVLLRVIVWSSVIPLFVGFYQFATGSMAITGRLASTFTHPNIYAFYCLLVLIVLLYLQRLQTQDESKKTVSVEKAVQWLILPCLLLSIVLTQTRSAWAALVVLGLVYGLLFSRKVLLWMLGSVVLAAMVPAVQERVLDLFTGNEVVQYAKLNSFAWRQYIWESGLNWMSPSRYLLGYGIGAFYFYSVDFFPMSGGTYFGAHNVFVERLFDGGLVAVSAFAVFISAQFLAAYKLIRFDKFTALFYVGLMVCYLILNTSDNVVDYLAYNWYYWVTAGAFYAMARSAVLNHKTA